MENLRLILALVGIVVVLFLLVKKVETRTALIGVGLVLCILCFKPMDALTAFTNSMTKAGLIKAICASMGFAFVMKFTKCDQHLVNALTKPLGNIGFFLIPIVTLLTYMINIAIPSAAGCSAAVGATLIPLLMASGVRPAMAGAAVFAGVFGSVLSPGNAHTIFVTEMVVKAGNPDYVIQDAIRVQMPSAFVALVIVLICITLMAFVFKDYTKGKNYLLEASSKNGGEKGGVQSGGAKSSNENSTQSGSKNSDEAAFEVNYLYALMPLIPLVILVVGGTKLSEFSFLTWTKMGVAEAMIIGGILAIFVTMTNPQAITKEFFNGMGNAYANVIGIIIAAGVFVAGLTACGAIEFVVDFLKNEQSYVKFGGTFIPYLMGIITGSGDAATFAFNEAITSQAAHLGFAQDKLGMAASIAGALGRGSSPIAGACIVCAGLAMANPVDLAKRTALGMFISVVVIAFFIL